MRGRLPLAGRLALVIFVVSGLSLAGVVLLSGQLTRLEYRNLLGQQERAAAAQLLEAHLAQGGTLSATALRDSGAAFPTPSPDGRRSPPRRPGPGGRPGFSFVLTDASFRPLPGQPWRGVPPDADRAQAQPITQGGRTVGYLVPVGRPEVASPEEEAFLRRVNLAAGGAALASALLAALAGLLLSRRLLRPLARLRHGIAALERGQAPTPQPTRPAPDEFGEVLGAFEQMHAQVTAARQRSRQLTADIAHDLNTPLTVLQGQLEAMRDGTFRPTPERLSELHAQTQRMARLLADLRLLAQADAGELPLRRAPHDLGGLLRGAAQDFAGAASRRGLSLAVHAPDGLLAEVDAHRMRQALDNLLANALTHTPAGGAVRLWAERDGPRLRLRVEDSGPGVPAEHLPHLFERLYRADEARAHHEGALGAGSGLGLSIVRSLVQAHGGAVAAENLPGGGFRVTLELPAT